MDMTLLIFLLVYLAMAMGHWPVFKVDRTGATLVGAMAMVVIGSIGAKAAWNAIDYKTIWLMLGLMVVSASFVVSGFYDWAADRAASLPLQPPALVAVLIAVGAVFSALLNKDVVSVAMVPLLISLTLARKLNPVPFLLAFCFAANIGATATLIGAPQNMIAGQTLGISFNGFLRAMSLPALVSLPVIWAFLVWLYRGKWTLAQGAQVATPATKPQTLPLNRPQTIKGLIVLLAVLVAFIFSPWPHELVALAAAGVLLVSRKVSSKDLMEHVNGSLLLLIATLFIVNAALAATGLPQHLLAHLQKVGIDLNHPLTLYLISAGFSDLVGNNPAIMLLVPYLDTALHPDALGAALVLGAGFSSNLFIFGSLAGIIMVEQAARFDIKISFAEYTRSGALITLVTMLIAGTWVWFLQ